MAYWGEAMTYNQTLWRNEDVAAGRQALARLGATPAARRARATSAREQGFLAAVEALFADGDAETRHRRYADEMARLYERFPDDADVASFYALALLGTMSRSLIGQRDAHEGHSETLAGSETQSRVSEILDRVLRTHPEHLGALHYLLHNDDDPEHAHLALGAARTLATLAPDSSHARHMPSHIFLQLGLWHDAADSDRAAFAASEAWVQRKQLEPGAAQLSRAGVAAVRAAAARAAYREAWATLDEIAPIVASQQVADAAQRSLDDARALRRRKRGLAASGEREHLRQRQRAVRDRHERGADGQRRARRTGEARTRAARAGPARGRSAARRRSSWNAKSRRSSRSAPGRGADAVAILQAAAQSEAQLPAPLGLPEPIKPAPELLGDVLIELGRGAEAVEPFELALRRNPNRSLSVLGLARASAAAQKPEAARRHYAAWLANMDRADADLPALGEAHAALGRPGTPDSSRCSCVHAALVPAAFAVLVAVALVLRAKKRGPVARAPRTSSVKRDGRNRRDRKDRRDQ